MTIKVVCMFLVLGLLSGAVAGGEEKSAEGVVKELYDLVTFPAGATPDWDKVRTLFLEEAVVILRTSKEANTVFSLEGFVADFVRFAARQDVQENGFKEEILKTKTLVFGDIAHMLVLYEASIPNKRPPQKGVDSFQLVRRGGEWKIASVLNEVPTAERPVPEMLK